MKLSEKFTNRNLDGMFKLILLFHGDKKKIQKNMCQNLCRII